MTITPERKLETFWKLFTQQVSEGEPEWIPRLHVERDGELLAVCIGVSPSQVSQAIPLALGAFRADSVTFCSDAWALVCPEGTTVDATNALLDRYGSVSGMFKARHPWATEALQMSEYHTDGTMIFGQIAYTRRSTYLRRTGSFVQAPDDHTIAEGRTVPPREILERVQHVREVLERVTDIAHLTSLGADMSAQRVVKNLTGLDFQVLVPFGDEDVPADVEKMVTEIAADMGYGDEIKMRRVGREGA